MADTSIFSVYECVGLLQCAAAAATQVSLSVGAGVCRKSAEPQSSVSKLSLHCQHLKHHRRFSLGDAEITETCTNKLQIYLVWASRLNDDKRKKISSVREDFLPYIALTLKGERCLHLQLLLQSYNIIKYAAGAKHLFTLCICTCFVSLPSGALYTSHRADGSLRCWFLFCKMFFFIWGSEDERERISLSRFDADVKPFCCAIKCIMTNRGFFYSEEKCLN